MHQHCSPSQFTLDFSPAVARRHPSLPLCPPHLLPDVVVAPDDRLLFVSDLEIWERMRACRSFDQMKAEMEAISSVAEQRQQYGARAEMGLGGPRTYQDVGTPQTIMEWMHEHEVHRLNQIKLSLPSTGEEVEAARQRIQQRIAARRATKRLSAA